MIKNKNGSYGALSKFFHWSVALLIITLLGLGKYMEGLPNSNAEEIAEKFWLFSLHKTLGMTIFILAVLRIIWAFCQTKPAPLASGKPIEHLVAEIVHFILYFMIILMPLSGWLHHSFAPPLAPIWLNPFTGMSLFSPNKLLSDYFSGLHYYAAILLRTAIILHVLGAIKHTVIDKDTTLRRMVPFMQIRDEPLSRHGSTLNPLLGAVLLVFGTLAMPVVEAQFMQQPLVKNTQKTAEQTSNQSPKQANAFETNWAVQYEKSSLKIAIDQSGSSSEGIFKTWDAQIQFDPENLGAAQTLVTIDIGSLELDSLTEQALSDDFLSSKNFATAEFRASEFKKTGDNQYVAIGELTLLGITKPFQLPFSLEIKDGVSKMQANLQLNRLDFGIGAKGFSDEGSVGFLVKIIIELTAKQL